QIRARDEPSEQRADGDRDHADPERCNDAVPDRLEIGRIGEDLDVISKCEAFFGEGAGGEDRAQRQEHEDNDEQRRAHPDGQRRVEAPQAEGARPRCALRYGRLGNRHAPSQPPRRGYAPKNSVNRFFSSALRFSSSSASTAQSLRSFSIGLSFGYVTSGWPV